MTVGELGERMDAPELMGWIERDQTTHTDAWLQTALICLTVSRVFGSTSATLDDYLPPKRKPGQATDPNEPDPDLDARLIAWATAGCVPAITQKKTYGPI